MVNDHYIQYPKQYNEFWKLKGFQVVQLSYTGIVSADHMRKMYVGE